MAKEEINKSPASFIPCLNKNGAVEYKAVFTPSPPDTTPLLLRYLQDNRDVYGHLYQYAKSPPRELTLAEQKAYLGISTLMGLGVGEDSPFQSLTEATSIILHFLSDSQQPATKAAFLQDEFGMRHVEAGFVEYPLRDSQKEGYELFCKATGIYQRLQESEAPQEGPTWLDMRVLTTYESLLANSHPPTPHNIYTHLGTQLEDRTAIIASLGKLQTLGEITRPSPRRHVQTAVGERADKVHLVVLSPDKPAARRKVKQGSLIA